MLHFFVSVKILTRSTLPEALLGESKQQVVRQKRVGRVYLSRRFRFSEQCLQTFLLSGKYQVRQLSRRRKFVLEVMAHRRTLSLQVEASDGDDATVLGEDHPEPELAIPTKGEKHSSQKEKPEWITLPDQPRETHLLHTLKPITSLSEAFEDLTSRAMTNGLKEVLASLAGRAIRVATMCSGTESPIVALELIRDCKALCIGIDEMLTRCRSQGSWARIQLRACILVRDCSLEADMDTAQFRTQDTLSRHHRNE